MKTKKSISYIELVTLFQNEGYTVKQLAKHFNLSETTIRKRLNECGITFTNKKEKTCKSEFTTVDTSNNFCGGIGTFRITDEDIEKLKDGKVLYSLDGIDGTYEYGISLVFV